MKKKTNRLNRSRRSVVVKILLLCLFCATAALFGSTLRVKNASLDVSRNPPNTPNKPKTPASQNTPNNQEQTEDATTLKARANKAKAKGQTQLVIESPIPIYAETKGLDEASTTYMIVVAKAVGGKSLMLDPHKLTTFQRFQIIDTLTTPEYRDCCRPDASDLPADITPPGKDHIYVRLNGGEQSVDNVEVVQKRELDFKNGEDYLLFLLPDQTGVIATIPLGPYGAFRIKGDQIESLLGYPHTLDTEITSIHGKSLGVLKRALRDKRR